MTTRVMLVDDAVVVRHILSDTLKQVSGIDVVGTAADGNLALQKLPQCNPDVVVLDVEMPNMDGIEALAEIKKRWPHIKVIMFSTLTSRGADATMDALMLGADDYVTKPANVGSVEAAIERIKSELVPKIHALHNTATRSFTSNSSTGNSTSSTTFGTTSSISKSPSTIAIKTQPSTVTPAGTNPPRLAPARTHTTKPRVVAIAVSTGGPNALAAMLPMLPGDLSAPVVIVQHIPPMFSKALADRLNTKCSLKVAECTKNSPLQAGQIWIAPGDYHMVVKQSGADVVLDTNQDAPENSCRPAADVLFRSVTQVFGGNVLAVVLTGMGSDGLKGAREIVKAGGQLIAQDEQTSVVWGMPGAVAADGICEKILPLEKIAAEITTRVGTSR